MRINCSGRDISHPYENQFLFLPVTIAKVEAGYRQQISSIGDWWLIMVGGLRRANDLAATPRIPRLNILKND